jgi:hypothetical protein
MRHLLFLTLATCLANSACQHVNTEAKFWKGDLIPPGSQQTLDADSTGVVIRTTHNTSGQVGRTVWQIGFRERNRKDSTPLFTVERVLDEPIPGAPFLDHSSGPALLRDKLSSYIYSLETHSFIRNSHPEAVYSGSYRNGL